MIVVTTENIQGYRIMESIGPVFGIVVRARGIGGDIKATVRSLVGGEIKEYSALLEDSRKQAVDRMVQNASAMGANAIVMMRFDSSQVGNMMSEVMAFGTAVVVEKD
jgi:uncharacterized protein YbjQ (UPF0145 family)